MPSSRRSLLASVLTVGLAGCLGDSTSDPDTIQTLDVAGSLGGTVPIAPSGDVVLLELWATWCAPRKP